MLGEIFAYYFGKSAGRSQERRRRQRSHPVTRDDVARARIVFAIVCICVLVAIAVGLFGHSPY